MSLPAKEAMKSCLKASRDFETEEEECTVITDKFENSNEIKEKDDLLNSKLILTDSESSEVLLNDIKPPNLIKSPIKVEKNLLVLNGIIKLIEGENLTSFLQRNPYKSNCNDPSQSKAYNRMKFVKQQKYSQFLRNIFYCFNNLNAIKALDDRYSTKLIDFLKSPTIKGCKEFIDLIQIYIEFFTKKPNDYKAIQFINTLEKIYPNRSPFETTLKAINYCFMPFKHIQDYLYFCRNNMINEGHKVEIIPENIIHELNYKEQKLKTSDQESNKFNQDLKKSIYEIRNNPKKREIKYKNKFFNK